MDILSKCDRSVFYFLVNLFADVPFVKIVDGFPEEDLTTPSISVDLQEINPKIFELGNKTRQDTVTWYIDIFADNKTQRDEYGFRILRALDDKINVYDYAQGFPPSTIPQIGCLDPDDVKLTIIKILPDLTEEMYYRANISFSATYSSIV